MTLRTKLEAVIQAAGKAVGGDWSSTHIYDGEEVIVALMPDGSQRSVGVAHDRSTGTHIANCSPEFITALCEAALALEEVGGPYDPRQPCHCTRCAVLASLERAMGPT